ncbi:BnaAnng12870D [Brassica napus]|uniref:(rape) hypothetical protein n=1 Tax=Brassica napus TaxID=3708 RepID=A0A078IV64_BRANA|nr:unnamed protein product [Brassica napus]CDY53821.1 BnaAnng12870D [Brassica napus]
MASSSGARKYPKRLYDVDKTPIQSRSMNHKLEYIWSASCVHHFLANQLAIDNIHEMWSLIDCMPLRFSLYEFGEITGLNCDPLDKNEIWDLQAFFPICRNWSREKRVMIGLLCLLCVGIFGISSNSRIPLHCAKRVMDPAAFQRYPWGRVGFTSLLESIKVLTYDKKKSYTFHGCVHALLIWVFEFVPGLGEKFGNRREGAGVPLLSWRGSRPRINFSDFCAQEKRTYQKVRVRHMVEKPIEDRYPKWEDNKVHTELDNMIQDILSIGR